MNIVAKWHKLSFFWQVYWFTVALVFVIVASVEVLGEQLFEPVFIHFFGQFTDTDETVLWFVSIFLLSPLSGWTVSRFIDAKLQGLAENSDKLARGDFSARAESTGNHKDTFGKIVTGFNVMAQKLENLFTMERRLLANVSHELRSPLTRMSMAVALAEESANDETRAHLEFIENEIEKMNDLIAFLLQQGKESLASTEQGRVEISSLLGAIAAEAAFEGRDKRKHVVCKVAENLTVHGSSIGLRTLFTNIVNNALKYTPPDTIVEMYAEKKESQIVVEVRDYGPGVPETMLEDIFRAFFRVDDSRTRDTGGVGLGLAIAKQMAYSHGGTITAQNAQPGLRVRIVLPAQS